MLLHPRTPILLCLWLAPASPVAHPAPWESTGTSSRAPGSISAEPRVEEDEPHDLRPYGDFDEALEDVDSPLLLQCEELHLSNGRTRKGWTVSSGDRRTVRSFWRGQELPVPAGDIEKRVPFEGLATDAFDAEEILEARQHWIRKKTGEDPSLRDRFDSEIRIALIAHKLGLLDVAVSHYGEALLLQADAIKSSRSLSTSKFPKFDRLWICGHLRKCVESYRSGERLPGWPEEGTSGEALVETLLELSGRLEAQAADYCFAADLLQLEDLVSGQAPHPSVAREAGGPGDARTTESSARRESPGANEADRAELVADVRSAWLKAFRKQCADYATEPDFESAFLRLHQDLERDILAGVRGSGPALEDLDGDELAELFALRNEGKSYGRASATYGYGTWILEQDCRPAAYVTLDRGKRVTVEDHWSSFNRSEKSGWLEAYAASHLLGLDCISPTPKDCKKCTKGRIPVDRPSRNEWCLCPDCLGAGKLERVRYK